MVKQTAAPTGEPKFHGPTLKQYPVLYLPWYLFPSWLISLILHGSMMLALLYLLPTAGGGDEGLELEGEGRDIGLTLRENGDGNSGQEGGPGDQQQVFDDQQPVSVEEEMQPESVPSVTVAELPIELPPKGTIGPSVGPSNTRSNHSSKRKIKFEGSSSPGGSAVGNLAKGMKGKGTSFMGLQATGQRFLYVIDCSGSMVNRNAIGVARAELYASLRQLGTHQQFQVVMFNSDAYPLSSPDGKKHFFWGTDLNRKQAEQQIDAIKPALGTDRLLAIQTALRFGPDAIFFLTDSDAPMQPGELDDVKRINRQKCEIHVVEFGKGDPLKPENFLKQLAREHRGSYKYVDILTFGTNER